MAKTYMAKTLVQAVQRFQDFWLDSIAFTSQSSFHWALPDKKCPPPIEEVGIPDLILVVSRTEIPEEVDSFGTHFQIYLIKFLSQFSWFPNRFYKSRLDFNTLTQFCCLDFQASFATNIDILYGERAFLIWNSPLPFQVSALPGWSQPQLWNL